MSKRWERRLPREAKRKLRKKKPKINEMLQNEKERIKNYHMKT